MEDQERYRLYSETLFTGYRNKHSVDFFIGIPSWGGTRSNVVLYPQDYAGREDSRSAGEKWTCRKQERPVRKESDGNGHQHDYQQAGL